MINKAELKNLIKKYFPEGDEGQVNTLLDELSREIEVMTHAKIRESVSFERIRRMNI